jgi:hypothetical protein
MVLYELRYMILKSDFGIEYVMLLTMSIQTQFNKFNKVISITRESEDYKAIREKDDSIRSDIKEAFEVDPEIQASS